MIIAEESVTADGASPQRRIEIIRTMIGGQSREEALTELYKAAKSGVRATHLAISVSLNRSSPAELGDLMVRHSEAGTSPCAQTITHMAAPDRCCRLLAKELQRLPGAKELQQLPGAAGFRTGRGCVPVGDGRLSVGLAILFGWCPHRTGPDGVAKAGRHASMCGTVLRGLRGSASL